MTSIPAVQSQPNQAAYGLQVLKTLIEYDRAGFKSAFGVDPPTYDPSLPTKSWFDSSAQTDKPYTYTTYVNSGLDTPVLKTITIPGSQAAVVNAYGIHGYPPYAIAPTQAAVVDPTGITNSPVKPENLSTKAQALDIATQIGVSSDAVSEITMTPVFSVSYPATEARRLYVVTFKSTAIMVGQLLQEQGANGVGAPGRWDLTGPEPNWISAIPSSLPPANPLQPVPMRELLPNEQFNVTLTGAEVERIDLGSQSGNAQGTAPAGDSPLVKQIAADVAALKGVFHLP